MSVEPYLERDIEQVEPSEAQVETAARRLFGATVDSMGRARELARVALRAAGVAAAEPEIEWGLALTEDHNEVEFAFPSREDVADYYSGPVSDADPGEHLVTRRKAGPWVPAE